MNLSRLIMAGGLAALCAVGCQGKIVPDGDADDDGNGGLCNGEPQPDADSFCGGMWECTDGRWQPIFGECPVPPTPEVCPEFQPANGTGCSSVGQQCTYEAEPTDCGEWEAKVTVECTESGWATLTDYCQPPPECPDALPLSGADCSDWPDAYWCSYETSCGNAAASCAYTEDGSLLWSVTSETTAFLCECPTAGSANECALYPECRWLAPGCDDGPAAPEGCYPAEPCEADACGEGASCATVSYNPCFNAECDACGAETLVCLADEGT